MDKRLHIMFAGGGTGGHLFPGFAVAEELTSATPSARITFCGTGRAWEHDQVARAGYEYFWLPAAPLIVSPLGLLRALYSNGFGYHRARRAIRTEQPDLIVGLGGFGSVPMGLAAARQGVPLVLLEQNVIAGRANRLLARWASAACTAFEPAEEQVSIRPRMIWTGNPVRASIIERATRPVQQGPVRNTEAEVLLILGGSQGARSLNRCIAEALPKIAPYLCNWSVIHQSGTKDTEWLHAAYAAAGIRADVQPFIEDMASAYGRAGLAVCRAGATTLAELAVAGVPAILVPYPLASANHQWHNAQAFGRAGAAVVVEDHPEPGRSAASVVASLLPLLKLSGLRAEMQRAMRALGRPAAAAAVVCEIFTTIEASERRRKSA